MEMLIKNAVVVSPADKLNEKTDILIKDGVIAEIGSGITSDGEIIDADGLCAVPGFVDMHVHFVIPVRLTKRILSRDARRLPQAVLQACLQCRTPTRQPTAPKL